MGGLDPAKILVILLVALVILGPERLPKAARQLGAFWRDLNRFREKMEQEVRNAVPDLDLPPIPAIPRGGLTGYLTGMMTSVSSSSRQAPRAGGSVSEAAGVAEAGGDFAVPGPAPAGSLTTAAWQSSSGSPAAGALSTSGSAASFAEGLPAGWQAVGAPAPGYASGSLLSGVPSGTAVGALDAEASFTFDEPSWN